MLIETLRPYWLEFSVLAGVHLLAVVSPGPDFAMVLRQSIAYDRRTAVWTAVGIGSGIFVHVAYSLIGLGLLLRQSDLLFALLKYAGAAYLAWIGWQAVRSRPRAPTDDVGESAVALPTPSAGQAWTTGFLTNALNPKATLFFVALFPMAVSAQTPLWVRIGYGGWMAVVTALWFSFVAVLFTQASVRRRFLRHGHWVDRGLGVLLLAFAARLALARLV